MHKKFPTLQSDGIYLKPMCLDDFELFKEIYQDSELMRYVGTPFTDKEISKRFNKAINQQINSRPKYIYYTIFKNERKIKIGLTGVQLNKIKSNHVEIGIIILEQFHRNGYAHISKSTLMHYLFTSTNIKTISVTCYKANKAANNANEKLGFEIDKEYLDKKNKISKIRWIIHNSKIYTNE